MFDGFGWSQAIPLVTSILGYEGQQDTNESNRQQATDQMAFQERMSSTAYQRAVKDMQAAGLNPMLAYQQGGATTPGGAMARMENSMQAGINSGQAAATVAATVDKLKADAEASRSQAALNYELGVKTRQDTVTSSAQASLNYSTAGMQSMVVNKLVEEIDQIRQNVRLSKAQVGKLDAEIQNLLKGNQLIDQDIVYRLAQTGNVEMDTRIKNLSVPRLINEAAAQSSWFMKEVAPYTEHIQRLGNSAESLGRGLWPWRRR